MNDLEEKYKELQKQNRILVGCNKKTLDVDGKLNVTIEYTCGNKEKVPFLKLLAPRDYYALLFGDVIYQKRLTCGKHCRRSLRRKRLKPFKTDADLKEIWDIEHGRRGYANITIRLATPALPETSTELA